MLEKLVETVGREAEPKARSGIRVDAAVFKIASRGAAFGRKQAFVIVERGLAVGLINAFAEALLLHEALIVDLVGHVHSRSLSKVPYRVDI